MRIASFVIVLSVLIGSWTLPLTQKEKRQLASSDPSADADPLSEDQSPTGCYITKEVINSYIR